MIVTVTELYMLRMVRGIFDRGFTHVCGTGNIHFQCDFRWVLCDLESGVSSGWSFLRVVFLEDGLSLGWSVLRKIFLEVIYLVSNLS